MYSFELGAGVCSELEVTSSIDRRLPQMHLMRLRECRIPTLVQSIDRSVGTSSFAAAHTRNTFLFCLPLDRRQIAFRVYKGLVSFTVRSPGYALLRIVCIRIADNIVCTRGLIVRKRLS